MADDERDPSEPVEHMPPIAVGPNPDGPADMAIAAHTREDTPAPKRANKKRSARRRALPKPKED